MNTDAYVYRTRHKTWHPLDRFSNIDYFHNQKDANIKW